MYDNGEEYGNDREYHIDDDDDDDLSYIETDRSSSVFKTTEQTPHGSLLAGVPHGGISDDSDEEKDYMALRSLVLYGK